MTQPCSQNRENVPAALRACRLLITPLYHKTNDRMQTVWLWGCKYCMIDSSDCTVSSIGQIWHWTINQRTAINLSHRDVLLTDKVREGPPRALFTTAQLFLSWPWLSRCIMPTTSTSTGQTFTIHDRRAVLQPDGQHVTDFEPCFCAVFCLRNEIYKEISKTLNACWGSKKVPTQNKQGVGEKSPVFLTAKLRHPAAWDSGRRGMNNCR